MLGTCVNPSIPVVGQSYLAAPVLWTVADFVVALVLIVFCWRAGAVSRVCTPGPAMLRRYPSSSWWPRAPIAES